MEFPFSSSEEKTAYALKLRQELDVKPFIHPSVEIPSWVEIGARVTIHQGCILGAEGFFLAKDKQNRFVRIPHLGKVIIEDDVEIFPNVTINRGLVGQTLIKQGAHIAHRVAIGHDCTVGRNVMIMVGAVIAGCVHLGDESAIGTHATILQHIRIGEGAFVGAGSLVRKDVQPHTVVVGNPSRVLEGKKPPHLDL